MTSNQKMRVVGLVVVTVTGIVFHISSPYRDVATGEKPKSSPHESVVLLAKWEPADYLHQLTRIFKEGEDIEVEVIRYLPDNV